MKIILMKGHDKTDSNKMIMTQWLLTIVPKVPRLRPVALPIVLPIPLTSSPIPLMLPSSPVLPPSPVLGLAGQVLPLSTVLLPVLVPQTTKLP